MNLENYKAKGVRFTEYNGKTYCGLGEEDAQNIHNQREGNKGNQVIVAPNSTMETCK